MECDETRPQTNCCKLQLCFHNCVKDFSVELVSAQREGKLFFASSFLFRSLVNWESIREWTCLCSFAQQSVGERNMKWIAEGEREREWGSAALGMADGSLADIPHTILSVTASRDPQILEAGEERGSSIFILQDRFRRVDHFACCRRLPSPTFPHTHSLILTRIHGRHCHPTLTAVSFHKTQNAYPHAVLFARPRAPHTSLTPDESRATVSPITYYFLSDHKAVCFTLTTSNRFSG